MTCTGKDSPLPKPSSIARSPFTDSYSSPISSTVLKDRSLSYVNSSGTVMIATTSIDNNGRLIDSLLIPFQILLSEWEADFFDGQNNFSFNKAMKNGTTV